MFSFLPYFAAIAEAEELGVDEVIATPDILVKHYPDEDPWFHFSDNGFPTAHPGILRMLEKYPRPPWMVDDSSYCSDSQSEITLPSQSSGSGESSPNSLP